MALTHPGVALIPLTLVTCVAITSATTTASARKLVVPFACRVRKVTAVHGINAGSTKFTDIDIDVENGTTNIISTMVLVDNSADVDTPDEADSATLEVLAENDVLHLDVVTTGGSTPTAIGYGCTLWVERV